jgi:hypothetical protein
MRSIYNYIPETKHFSRVCSVAALRYLQFVRHVMLFRSSNMFCLLLLLLLFPVCYPPTLQPSVHTHRRYMIYIQRTTAVQPNQSLQDSLAWGTWRTDRLPSLPSSFSHLNSLHGCHGNTTVICQAQGMSKEYFCPMLPRHNWWLISYYALRYAVICVDAKGGGGRGGVRP